jgi:LysR family glycine cleavage system transcriptional activator
MQPNYLPDLESLRCFEAAARHLSFRAAAREVALSPPAFSDRIRRLEEDLEVALFARTTRRVGLTDAGVRLLPRARQAIATARACVRAAHEGEVPFELTVGTRFELGLSWLTPALDPLARACPGRTLHLVFGDSPDLLERTLKGSVDATVTSARLSWAHYAYALLHEEAYVFVGAPELVDRRPLEQEADAEQHVLIDASADLPLFRYLRDASPAEEAWRFARVERLGTIGAILQRVLDGAGVAVLPRYLVREDLDEGRLVRLLVERPLLTDHFRLVWRTDHPREVELADLAAQLRELPLR